MTKDQLTQLCNGLRKKWTKKTGSVALVLPADSTDSMFDGLRVCVGTVSNNGLVPSKCTIWQGDDKLFDGTLGSPEMKAELDKHSLCLALIADTVPSSESEYICLGRRKSCNKDCVAVLAEDE